VNEREGGMRAIYLFSKALNLPKFVFGLFVIVAVVVFVCLRVCCVYVWLCDCLIEVVCW
jgi:hypothetical protein